MFLLSTARPVHVARLPTLQTAERGRARESVAVHGLDYPDGVICRIRHELRLPFNSLTYMLSALSTATLIRWLKRAAAPVPSW